MQLANTIYLGGRDPGTVVFRLISPCVRLPFSRLVIESIQLVLQNQSTTSFAITQIKAKGQESKNRRPRPYQLCQLFGGLLVLDTFLAVNQVVPLLCLHVIDLNRPSSDWSEVSL